MTTASTVTACLDFRRRPAGTAYREWMDYERFCGGLIDAGVDQVNVTLGGR